MKALLILIVLAQSLIAGPFAPAANQSGTTAIPLDDTRIARWANRVESFSPGEDLDAMWQDTSHALSPASTDPTLVTSLGRGGEIILAFDPPIKNGHGPDFAVFENSFAHTFLELAFVEVSSDGETFQRFPNSSLTPSAVGPFGFLDPTNLEGFAGKYIGGFGTPFDLANLDSPLSEIRFIKLIDVTGGTSRDSTGAIIFDPFPTQGSAGFDLSGIAVLETIEIVSSVKVIDDDLVLTWNALPGKSYFIQATENLGSPWKQIAEKEATQTSEQFTLPLDSPKQFYRVILK